MNRELLALVLTLDLFPLAAVAQTPREPGWTVSVFESNIGRPANGLWWDCVSRSILVTDAAGDRVLRCDGVNPPVVFATVPSPDELAIDRRRDRVAVKQHSAGPVHFFRLDGTPLGQVPNIGANIGGIGFDSDGNFYAADIDLNQIVRYDEASLPPASPVGSPFTTDLASEGIRFRSTGEFFAADVTNRALVEVVPPAGPHISWAALGGLPIGVTEDPCSGDMLVSVQGRSAIVRVRAPSVSNLFADGLVGGPYGLDFDDDGNLYVAEFVNGRVLKFSTPNPCSAQPIADAGPDPAACVPGAVDLDGAASAGCGVAGTLYRWLDGATVVCGWSTSSRCTVSPAATTAYTLEVQCATNCPRTSSDTVTVSRGSEVVADLAPLPNVCGMGNVDLDASGSRTVACTVPLVYRFREGATVLRPFGPSPTFGPVPVTVSTVFTVDVRCPTTSCEASVSQSVSLDPDLLPAGLGNSLRSVRLDQRVVMSWSSVPEARTYSLWRDTQKGIWMSPLRQLLAATTDTELDIAQPPALYFYRVAGASCSGREGP